MVLSYSYCTTVYNSVETVDMFLDSLNRSKMDFEIVITDNNSNDGTYEKLMEYSNVKTIRETCKRGRGRQLAIDNSKNDIIVMLDADVEYNNLDKILTEFERSGETDLLWHMYCRDETGLMPIVIAKRSLIELMRGYPNLNAGEDTYMYLLAEKIGRYKKIVLEPGTFKGIALNGNISGNERRYNKTLSSIVIKRVLFTRDTLFVNDFTFSGLLKYYKLSGLRGNFIGLVEFVLGKLLKFGLNEETVDMRAEMIRGQQ